jgi:5'-deoxynucleotidase YfbR-like HD superfamily hydrolase
MVDTCWIQTYSGIKMHPLSPTEEEISIEDIAHALSNLCRFTGHCNKFYSVAQHSVLVSVYSPRDYAMWGLLHDASEAYLNDIARPIKISDEYNTYRKIEENLMKVIAKKI